MTEPLLRRLAQRGERLTVGALPWVAPVYRAMPQVAEVLDWPFAHGGLQWRARWRVARGLRGQFDRAYVCPNSIKSALLPWLAGVPLRVGRVGEGRWGLLNQRLPNPPAGQRPPMVPFYDELALAEGALAPVGSTPSDAAQSADGLLLARMPAGRAAADAAAWAAGQPQLRVAPDRLLQTVQRHALRVGAYVVLVPGAEFGPAKRWPAAHYAQLAALLAHPVVLLGSARETDTATAIVAQAHALGAVTRPLNLCGRTSLDDALALIAGAAQVVSNDSGLMHVAAALGVPQVAVFGSSSPLHTPPLSAHAKVLWLKQDPDYAPALDCAPCFKRDCPLGHTRCLADVTPERVFQAMRSE